ncbi:LysM peptidoglycan-binding domain-containing protein [bacterium]|nr:LysM peptidoglycan-binding domain-containing protein [bacterium]
MTTTTTTTTAVGATIINSRTYDHRTSSTQWGGCASRYQRPARRRVAAPIDQPNYAARRLGALIVAFGSVVVVASLINGLLTDLGGSPAIAAETASSAGGVQVTRLGGATVQHVARPGDSLWSIADEHRGVVDRDRYVDELINLNGSTSIVVGQAIRLP